MRCRLLSPIGFAHTPTDSKHNRFANCCPIPVESEPHKIQRLFIEPSYLPIRFQPKTKLCELFFYGYSELMQFTLVAAEYHHIVHVACIVIHVHRLFQPMVKVIHKEIGKHLTEQHAYQQLIAFRQCQLDKLKKIFVFDFLSEHFHKFNYLFRGYKRAETQRRSSHWTEQGPQPSNENRIQPHRTSCRPRGGNPADRY